MTRAKMLIDGINSYHWAMDKARPITLGLSVEDSESLADIFRKCYVRHVEIPLFAGVFSSTEYLRVHEEALLVHFSSLLFL
jgi:hypothetical protein